MNISIVFIIATLHCVSIQAIEHLGHYRHLRKRNRFGIISSYNYVCLLLLNRASRRNNTMAQQLYWNK